MPTTTSPWASPAVLGIPVTIGEFTDRLPVMVVELAYTAKL